MWSAAIHDGSRPEAIGVVGRLNVRKATAAPISSGVHRRWATADAMVRGIDAAVTPTRSLSHRREQHHLSDGPPAAQDHDQAVDAHADAARRRHPLLERLQEGLVEGLRLLVAGGGQAALRLEPGALLVGVV